MGYKCCVMIFSKAIGRRREVSDFYPHSACYNSGMWLDVAVSCLQLYMFAVQFSHVDNDKPTMSRVDDGLGWIR